MGRAGDLPGWPLHMPLAMSCSFLHYTAGQFNAFVQAGLLPAGRDRGDGVKVWHREELEACSRRIFKMEKQDDHGQAVARAAAADRLAGFVPPAVAARRARQKA